MSLTERAAYSYASSAVIFHRWVVVGGGGENLYKSDNLSERWTNKWGIVTDYEEKFKTYDNDGNDYRY